MRSRVLRSVYRTPPTTTPPTTPVVLSRPPPSAASAAGLTNRRKPSSRFLSSSDTPSASSAVPLRSPTTTTTPGGTAEETGRGNTATGGRAEAGTAQQQEEVESPAIGGYSAPEQQQQQQQQQQEAAMASDDAYMAFLDKADRDAGEAQATAAAAHPPAAAAELRATDGAAEVPPPVAEALKDAAWLYVSDADEPFVPVALKWDEGGRGLPDEEEFARLVGHPEPARAEALVQILDPAEWDAHGRYGALVAAVRAAAAGNDVRVYRVQRHGPRAEYWLVARRGDGAAASLVGAKALAVES